MSSSYFGRSIGADAAYERLERLVRQRTAPDADKIAIDARIWDLFGEEWAILYTDLSGFSRRVAEFGIIHFLQTILESEQLFTPIVEEHGGILLKVEGDSQLIIFRNPERALACTIEMQRATWRYNEIRADEEKILLCAGLGYGRILRIGNADVFGAEVNAASKLGEDTADAGEILVTAALQRAVDSQSAGTLRFVPIDYVPPGAEGAYRVDYSD